MNKRQNILSSGKKKGIIWSLLFLFLTFFPDGVGAVQEYTIQTIPNVRLADRNNYVSNPDAILNPEEVDVINRTLKALEDSLGIEVAVVAVESIGKNDARMFATDLFKQWGIGKKADDNGLLIQLVTEPEQRSVVFETGYGLEGVLPDVICYRIQQQYMIPDLKEGAYSAGVLKGVLAVTEYLLASDYERSEMLGEEEDHSLGLFLMFFLLLPLGFVFLISYLQYTIKRRPKVCPQCGNKTLVYVKQETLRKPTYQAEGLAVDIYRCKNCRYTKNRNKTLSRLQKSTPIILGGGGGGFGSGGSFGGGSFGGGRSGGGGSISRF
ncbi:TPM domain-containing protein [Parabacteroides sp. 52]|uniref:TPM domain-containing protein n=1 Tax=unclassified Parabacteroides TaxID=2649774 RepID=UPI0013D5905C|nr:MULTISPECIES: TPM domain-containing protein [unclassified Parabacteroides]MDH6534388.1 uncharacterized protein [Parabacteroides sp. PM5-20]NDV54887.1 TPM domain-containing protein [Parabacteroides sp. 52]